MNNQPDHYYIEKTLSGDVNAFSSLVKKYENMVFSISFKMMGNREEAEDVAQEVFIKSFKSLKNFKGDAKFSTWLYRISYNYCLDTLKKNKRYVRTEEMDKINNDAADFEMSAFEVLVQKERKMILEQALKRLPEDEQVMMTLYYFEELPIKEISTIMNINANNIKVKLYRSRSKLVSLLKDATVALK